MSAAHLRAPPGPSTMTVLYLRAWADGFQAGAVAGFAAGAADAYELGCGGKVRQSRETATATLDRRGALRGGDWGATYKCKHCGFYHTAHREEPDKWHRTSNKNGEQ